MEQDSGFQDQPKTETINYGFLHQPKTETPETISDTIAAKLNTPITTKQDDKLTKISTNPLSPESLICQTCHKIFSTKSNLRKHERAAKCYSSLYCELCNRHFTKPALFKLHLENHKKTPEIHECNHCEKIFTTKAHLLEHQANRVCGEKRKKITDNEQSQMFKCDYCEKSYKQKRNLLSHVKQAHKPKTDEFTCDLCDGLEFSTKGALTRHIKQKHSNKQKITHSCDLCHKNFTNKSNLKKHLSQKICQKEKPDFITVVCSNCGFKEKRKSSINNNTSSSSSLPLIVNCSACDSVILIH